MRDFGIGAEHGDSSGERGGPQERGSRGGGQERVTAESHSHGKL